MVSALLEFDDGNGSSLYAGGSFTAIGGQTRNRIARWDGNHWQALGTGLTGGGIVPVQAMVAFDDGTGSVLVVGGEFSQAGASPAKCIAKWDGVAWAPMGAGFDGGPVKALAVYDGELYAGGAFMFSGGQAVAGLARWNGSAWVHVGQQLQNSANCEFGIRALVVGDIGSGLSLFAGGEFGLTGIGNVARWNGSTWHPVGNAPGVNECGISALRIFDDGGGPLLYAAMENYAPQPHSVIRWRGSAWENVGQGLGSPTHWLNDQWEFQEVPDGPGSSLYVVGPFSTSQGAVADRIARWTGVDWQPVGTGLNGSAVCMAVFDEGNGAGPELYVGGSFTEAGGEPSHYIARWGCLPATLETSYCFGSEAVCPCGNPGGLWRGCGNSTGIGARLGARPNFGSFDDLELQAGGLVPGQPGLLFVGMNPLNGGFGIPMGDGLRCVWGNLVRIGVAVPDANGRAQWGPGLATLGGWQLGDARHFQVWYRDPAHAGPGGFGCVGQNLTNALEVRFMY